MLDQSPALDSGSIAAAAEANRRLEHNPAEQAILATIQELRSKGHSLRSVGSALNRKNHRLRRGSECRPLSVALVIR